MFDERVGGREWELTVGDRQKERETEKEAGRLASSCAWFNMNGMHNATQLGLI